LDLLANTFTDLYYNPRIREALVLAGYMLLGGILALYLRALYRRYGLAVSNRDRFSSNFALVTISTSLIIFVVKSKLALSLGLVGALSIIRFRAAIKEPEEIVFLFFCIALGLSLGAEYYELAISGTVVFSLFVILRHSSAAKQTPSGVLITINGSEEEVYSSGNDKIAEAMTALAPGYTVQRMEIEAGQVRFRAVLQEADTAQIAGLVTGVRGRLPGCSVSYVNLENLL
jgi:hypothetical protein